MALKGFSRWGNTLKDRHKSNEFKGPFKKHKKEASIRMNLLLGLGAMVGIVDHASVE